MLPVPTLLARLQTWKSQFRCRQSECSDGCVAVSVSNGGPGVQVENEWSTSRYTGWMWSSGVDNLLASEGDIEKGAYKLLFSAPEAVVVTERWRRLLLSSPLHNPIVALVVDECHCVHKW